MPNSTKELSFDSILLDIKPSSKKQLFQKIASHVANLTGTSEKDLVKTLTHNEDKQNSGIGNGVALIHADLSRLTKPMTILVKVSNALSYNALDHRPVDIIVLLLSPHQDGALHLQRLSALSRFFSNETIGDLFRQAKSFDEIRAILKSRSDTKKAA